MEVKNGIIIDGELHEYVEFNGDCGCDECSLRNECNIYENDWSSNHKPNI